MYFCHKSSVSLYFISADKGRGRGEEGLHFSQRGPRNPWAHSQNPYWPHRPPFKQSKSHKSDATKKRQN